MALRRLTFCTVLLVLYGCHISGLPTPPDDDQDPQVDMTMPPIGMDNPQQAAANPPDEKPDPPNEVPNTQDEVNEPEDNKEPEPPANTMMPLVLDDLPNDMWEPFVEIDYQPDGNNKFTTTEPDESTMNFK